MGCLPGAKPRTTRPGQHPKGGAIIVSGVTRFLGNAVVLLQLPALHGFQGHGLLMPRRLGGEAVRKSEPHVATHYRVP